MKEEQIIFEAPWNKCGCKFDLPVSRESFLVGLAEFNDFTRQIVQRMRVRHPWAEETVLAIVETSTTLHNLSIAPVRLTHSLAARPVGAVASREPQRWAEAVSLRRLAVVEA